MENQHDNSSLTASQDYLQEHMPAKNGNWMNRVTSAIPNSFNSAFTQVKGMSTTQKVAGGAILAAGAWYLANRTTVNGKIQQMIATRTQGSSQNQSTTSMGETPAKTKSKSKRKTKSNAE